MRASRTGFAAAIAEATPFLPGLSAVWTKALTATRDVGNLSSNGELVVLREAARRLDLAGVIADPLPDTRNPLFVIHSYRTMVTARMMAIAAGYEDAGPGLDPGPRRAAPRSRAHDCLRTRAGDRRQHPEPAHHLAPGEPRRRPDADAKCREVDLGRCGRLYDCRGTVRRAEAQTKVRVGWCTSVITNGVAPFAIATKLGWFKELGIEVEVVNIAGSSDCVRNVAAGEVLVAVPTMEPVAILSTAGVKTQAALRRFKWVV